IVNYLDRSIAEEPYAHLKEGYRKLASHLDLVNLPQSLIPGYTEFRELQRSPSPTREELRSRFLEWIASLPEAQSGWPKIIRIGRLAAFNDLPNLNETELTHLVKH